MSKAELISDMVQKAGEGDQEASRQLYTWLNTELSRQLKTMVSSKADLDDVIQSTLIETWRGLKRLRDQARILGFARRIARRQATKNRLRRRRWVCMDSVPERACRDCSFDNLAAEELVTTLRGSLRNEERDFFELLYVSGASSTELRDQLKLSPEALWMRKHRLREKLRRIALYYEG